MAIVRFGDISCALEPGETVLDGLERAGASIPSSCRVGACRSCLVQARAGAPTEASRRGLRETWRQRGYFLACLCRPQEDLEIALVGAAAERPATVVELARLSPSVTRVRLALSGDRSDWTHEPGQFINLARADGLTRSYSLASLAGEPLLELHVRRMLGGRMSTWLHEQVRVGDAVRVRGPLGECFYTPDAPDAPLLLVGVGTGLAPLWGVAREALRQAHRGPIALVHGARDPSGLYMRGELTSLARATPQLRYIASTLDGDDDDAADHEPIARGTVLDHARAELARLGAAADTRVFLCGDPELVKSLKRAMFLAGVPLRGILSDAFVTAAPPAPATTTNSA
ncbi:MAG: 2Fe-2S iron-sulfur cluster binding domain-containing protein [Myxococcales bacterium]|nr:2Fe-2S iron-sulfur cluster binding domain-containing protein [Myxococcales bacterium]MCB9751756.1 2Fe-2S iron-sulfur cluster binding domain-containing protein [Myxococcales bacterium]